MSRKKQKSSETMDKVFAFHLRQLMKDRSIKQIDLSRELGIQRQTVSNYANGQSSPDAETILKIADYFHVSADYLLGRDSGDDPNRNAAQISENWTGLSQKALSVLHDLHNLGYDMAALNALLERISFYRTVLEYVGKAVDSMQKNPGCEYEPTNQEGEAAVLLLNKGWITMDPNRAISFLARSAGDELNREINNIHDERENDYLIKFSNSLDKSFVDGLKMKKEDS